MGDINALSRAQGFYADITGMPNNLAEAQNMLIKMENDFNSLPVDIKKSSIIHLISMFLLFLILLLMDLRIYLI